MDIVDRWLLPDGIEEILPPQAERLEAVRRRLLDQFARSGFELVVTPMVEYLESLLTGTGSDLDLKTFKVTDQISGRTMGIRADMTPQVARIDAHSLGRDEVTRLCYAGTILHAIADNMLASRSPVSVGAELFGETGRAGDLEIVSLMLECIRAEGIEPLHSELGDVGIFRDLIEGADITAAERDHLFRLIQRKATDELGNALEDIGVAPTLRRQVEELPTLCGDESVLPRAMSLFDGHDRVMERLENLRLVAEGLAARFADLDLHFDLSELRGYAYHTGIVFAAYEGTTGVRLAKGGRYDDIGGVFGRPRAATGFDIDLKALTRCSRVTAREPARVTAPPADDPGEEGARWQFIRELRQQGFVVIEGSAGACDYAIELKQGNWQLVERQA